MWGFWSNNLWFTKEYKGKQYFWTRTFVDVRILIYGSQDEVFSKRYHSNFISFFGFMQKFAKEKSSCMNSIARDCLSFCATYCGWLGGPRLPCAHYSDFIFRPSKWDCVQFGGPEKNNRASAITKHAEVREFWELEGEPWHFSRSLEPWKHVLQLFSVSNRSQTHFSAGRK